MKSKFRRSGGSRLRKRLRMMPEAVRQPIRNEMRDIGGELADRLEAKAPKRTGALGRASAFSVSKDGLGVSVGYSNREPGFKQSWRRGGFAAQFIEFGTKHHPAEPFIRPLWRSYIRGALDRIERVVAKAIRSME